MNNATALPQPVITIVNQQPMTTSIDLARFFGKEHHHVLEAIQKLELSEEFRQSNFRESSYINGQGKKQPMYTMTRDGFAFVGLGFNGKKAAQFKEAYIKAFNLMEEKLRNRPGLAFLPAPEPPALQLVRARQTGFDQGVRFTEELRRMMQAHDLDETTLHNLCFYRIIGLNQREAATLCIIPRTQCERIEKLLASVGCRLPAQNPSTRKARVRATWTALIAQAGAGRDNVGASCRRDIAAECRSYGVAEVVHE
jgi:Rha family phage regulatory protein